MKHFRLATLVASLVCALLIGGAASAQAQTSPVPFAKTLPLAGKTTTGKKLKNATFTVQSFSKKNGKIVANGVARGILKGKSFKQAASVPVKNPNVVAGGAKTAQVLPPIPNSCQVLNLVLGPINLNLLGLVVRTNTINVRIDAVPGAGNLLGNLLCSITNLLNPGSLSGTPLGQLTQILNALLALAPKTA
jgi:hypothetical protein